MSINLIIGAGVASIFGTSIITQTVNATISTTYGLLSYLTYGSTTNEVIKSIKRRIEILDIAVKLKLADKIINIDADKKTLVQTTLETDINDIILNINELLQQINVKIEEHSQKWFSSYRSLPVNDDLDELETKCTLLDRRLNLMLC
jgi:hypothetical protein